MSDLPRSSSTFSFGTASTSGGSGLFGTTPANNSSGGLFGADSAQPASQSGSILESKTTAPETSSSGIFGSAPGTSAPATSLFGGGAAAGPLGSVLGGAQKPSGENVFGGGNNSKIGFSGFSTPSKSADTPSSGPGQTPSLFGGGTSTGGNNLFGNLGGAQATSSQAGSTTPAPSKSGGGFLFGGVSTTPAGPPPAGSIGQGETSKSGFNFRKPQDPKPGFFGNTAPSPLIASSNPFGGSSQTGAANIFSTSKPADDSASTSTSQSSSTLFGGGASASTSSSNPFGAIPASSSTTLFGSMKTAAASGPSLFPNLGTTQPSTSHAPTSDSSKSSFFPSLTGQNASSTATSQPSGFPSLGSNSNDASSTTTKSIFSAPPTITPQSAAAISSGAISSGSIGLFGSLGGATVTSPTGTGPASSQPGSLFPSIPGKNLDFNSGNVSTSTSGASTSAPGAISPFGSTNNSSNPPAATTTQSTTKVHTINVNDDASKSTANLGTSTSGPRPPAQSRLKNKSMDEIITRWASDLSKYQKDFQKQALKVSEWDRMLVENSDKIQKLYGGTLEAERATIEVERQLSTVENDQAELEYWLDHYEGQVDELTSSQIGPGETTQGPDQERERIYKLAEKLSDRLNEMGKDLTSMIENINDASSSLSKNNNSDDPLSQIVRVLNGHLSQLQQIDQGAAVLQAKVVEAQKASRNAAPTKSLSGLRGDAADDFYRSYMGRR